MRQARVFFITAHKRKVPVEDVHLQPYLGDLDRRVLVCVHENAVLSSDGAITVVGATWGLQGAQDVGHVHVVVLNSEILHEDQRRDHLCDHRREIHILSHGVRLLVNEFPHRHALVNVLGHHDVQF